VRNLVELHGGSIYVDSDGAGERGTVKLPLEARGSSVYRGNQAPWGYALCGEKGILPSASGHGRCWLLMTIATACFCYHSARTKNTGLRVTAVASGIALCAPNSLGTGCTSVMTLGCRERICYELIPKFEPGADQRGNSALAGQLTLAASERMRALSV